MIFQPNQPFILYYDFNTITTTYLQVQTFQIDT